jgi:carbon-monoxide dehydrogenase large subunit
MLPSGGWEHASVTIERSGHITATTGASPHGQGNETTFAQMLADEFGVPMDDINILHGDTAIVRHGLGTYGSRSQAVGGAALMMASGKVKEKMSRFAAALLEAKAEDMVFENKMVSVRGVAGSGLPFADVAAYAYRPVPMPPDVPEPGLSDEAFFEPSNATFPFGCYISMVEVDRDTGEIAIRKFVGVDDCGTVVNPLIVRGQIHGGLAQGIGQALIEEVVYDEDGQLVTGSFMDYAIARASDFPRFELSHTETRSPVNPLGAKGIGEAGTIGSTPCIVNAVVDALSPFGVKHLDMMMRPEKVWRLMQGGAS